MRLTITNRLYCYPPAFCVLACLWLPAGAQYTPTPPPLTTAPCVPTRKEPCVIQPPASAAPPSETRFPFPGEPPASGDEKTVPAGENRPAAPKSFPFPEDVDKPAPPSPSTPATRSFPFPEETEAPKPSSSASSSSSSSNADQPIDGDEANAGKPALTDKGSSGLTRMERRHLSKVEDLDKREADDLDVSHYYATTGNFPGSYLRAQDAVKLFPDDPLAHFALAESARNIKKKDEAIAEYKLYLKLDPAGEKAKSALRALAEIAPK